LIEWLESKTYNDVFYTDLTKNLPREIYVALALSISKVPQNYILWFRPEVTQTVNCNPSEVVELEQDGSLFFASQILCSMARNGSINVFTLKQCEIDGALELRSAMLRQLLNWQKIIIRTQQQRTRCFAYIASDLKEPLRGIHNSSFLIEDYADVLNVEGVSKLQTMMRLPNGRLD